MREVDEGARPLGDSAQQTTVFPDQPGERAWKVSLWCALMILGGLVFIAIAQRTVFRSQLAVVRDAFLVHYTADASLVYRPPTRLFEDGFRVDPPETRAEWSARVSTVGEFSASLENIRDDGDELERGEALAKLLTQGDDGSPSVCGAIGDLGELLRFVARGGFVCCSDYTAAFLALAPQVGLTAREMRVDVPHGVVEIYSKREQRWIMIDPLFNMVATGRDGTALSTWEVRRAIRNQDIVRYRFFGRTPDESREDRNRSTFDSIYGPRFGQAQFSTPMGNNVIMYDDFRRPLAYLPKAIVQAMALGAGIFPQIVSVTGGADDVWKGMLQAAVIRIVVIFSATTLLLGLVAGPVVWIWERLSVHFAALQVAAHQ